MKKLVRFSIFLHLLLVLLALPGSGFGQAEESAVTPDSNRNYKIGVGDVLNIVVTRQNLLSLDGLRVSNAGKIRMPQIKEDIRAACLTEVQLAEALSEKYKKYVLEPEIFVRVVEFNSNPVAFMGAVNSPGRFDVRRPARLLEMLTLVNGPAPNAGNTIQIIRQNRGSYCEDAEFVTGNDVENQELLSFSLEQTMKGESNANPLVRSGDIITVTVAEAPEEAYVIGNVANAQRIVLDQPITISMAIAMSGGATNGAKIDKIKITRQDPDTLLKSEIVVNLKEISKQNEIDVLLQANDIVEVPGPSGAKKFFSDIIRTIVPLATRSIIPVF